MLLLSFPAHPEHHTYWLGTDLCLIAFAAKKGFLGVKRLNPGSTDTRAASFFKRMMMGTLCAQFVIDYRLPSFLLVFDEHVNGKAV
jgi:hypothetical protein